MKILLDTHVWLWAVALPGRIGSQALEHITDRETDVFLSAASSWEIAIKYQIGKLQLPSPPDEFIPPRLLRDGITPLPIEHRHVFAVAHLPRHHRDPFDRLLIAQALAEKMTIFTADTKLDLYDADCILV